METNCELNIISSFLELFLDLYKHFKAVKETLVFTKSPFSFFLYPAKAAKSLLMHKIFYTVALIHTSVSGTAPRENTVKLHYCKDNMQHFKTQ